MKFTCDRADILAAVNKAEKAVAAKSTLPVMEGILVNVTSDEVILTGNDLEIAIEASFKAEITKTGKIVLNCRMFSEIIRKTGGDTVSFEASENMLVTITSGFSVFEIAGLDANEFPSAAEFDIDKKISIESSKLKAMIRQTIFATSKGEFRQILTGELFKIEGDVLNVVALDGHRLAIRREKLIDASYKENFVVPFKTLNEILKIIDDEGVTDIYPSKKNIMFEFGGCKLYSRVIDGEFLNYDKIIAVECPIKMKADIRKIKGTFERVSPIIYNETVKSPVRINVEDDKIIIDCVTLSGKIHDEVNITKLYGDNLEIGFTNQYLLDAFGACEDNEVFLEFSTPLSPIVITPIENDKFLYIILPVRLKK